MVRDGREFARLRNWVLLVSAAAWVWLVASSQFSSGSESHVHGAAGSQSHTSGSSLFQINPLPYRAIDWFLMLVAMMAPTLIMPLWYIRARSFARRRRRSLALFVFGYSAVWMILGALVLAADASLGLLRVQTFGPAAMLAIIALVWQASPAKQRFLNRCHSYGSFAACGPFADLDMLRFGLSHAIWCVGSCWALMLFPMLLPRGHLAAMVAVSILVFSERLENPAPLGWRFRGLSKIIRIILAQRRLYSCRFSSEVR